MSNRIAHFGEQKFSDVMTFMRHMQDLGYDQEFENSLVLRMLWQNLDQLWSDQGKKKGSYEVVACHKKSLVHPHYLEVMLRDTQTNSERYLELLERNGALVVITNVLLKKEVVDEPAQPVPMKIQPLPDTTKSVSVADAPGRFRTMMQYGDPTGRVFDAMCKAMKSPDPTVPQHVRLRPTRTGVEATFVTAGKPVVRIHFAHSTHL